MFSLSLYPATILFSEISVVIIITKPLQFGYYLCYRDFEVVGHFLPVVLNLPSSCHVAVRHTSIKLVGELADWIEKHPEYLGRYTAENLV